MKENPRSQPAPDEKAPLPPERAFVVQLRPRSGADGELFVGRVEHIASGAGTRFESATELLAFIALIGEEQGPES